MSDAGPRDDDGLPWRFLGDQEPGAAQQLVRLALADYRLIRGSDGRAYAVPHGGPNQAFPLEGGAGHGLRARLTDQLWSECGQVATASALSDCVRLLESRAARQDPQEVWLRVGRYDLDLGPAGDGGQGVVVDLGTASGECILITADGWQVLPTSPILFRRSQLMHPHQAPVRGGTLDGLRAVLNLGDEDFHLVVGWIVAAFLPSIPHPILLVQGEHGTAKTSLIRTLTALIDPQSAAERTPPAGPREWAITARASWAIAFDNVSEVPRWWSDALCKGVTGDAVIQRALYSTDDLAVHAFRRVIAIATVSIRRPLAGDLLDRILLIEPDVIDQMRTEEELAPLRRTALPEAFGAVLDLTASVLAALPDVTADHLPRMADFARVLAALDAVTGWRTLASYRDKLADLTGTLIQGDKFAQAVHSFIAAHGDGHWVGTITELMTELHTACRRSGLADTDLPRTPQAAGKALTNAAPALRKIGIDIRRGKSGPRRPLTIRRGSTMPDPSVFT